MEGDFNPNNSEHRQVANLASYNYPVIASLA